MLVSSYLNPHISLAWLHTRMILNINSSANQPGGKSACDATDCTVRNFPMQRWVHMLIGKFEWIEHLDVYSGW
jgi:hypothetical protein